MKVNVLKKCGKLSLNKFKLVEKSRHDYKSKEKVKFEKQKFQQKLSRFVKLKLY